MLQIYKTLMGSIWLKTMFLFLFHSSIIFFHQIPIFSIFNYSRTQQPNGKKKEKHYQSKYRITITIANDIMQISILDFSFVEYFIHYSWIYSKT